MLLRSVVIQEIAAALFLGALPYVAAHGGDEMPGMDMETPKVLPIDQDGPTAIAHKLESYYRHPHHAGWNLAHTIFMIAAWFVVMPLALMLSTARSRYHLPAQIVFHICNGLGVFAGFVYNHSTPDLYINNSHHPLGWAVTGFTIAWTLMSFYTAYGEYRSRRASLQKGQSLSSQMMAQYDDVHQYNDELSPRHSRDSGQGTERNSASLFGSRQNSSDSVYQKAEEPIDDVDLDNDEKDAQEPERQGFLGENRVDRFISKSVRRFSTPRVGKVVRFSQIFLEKVLLLLGFAALTSGFIVAGGLFRNRQIFSGLAHYIKGGIFVFYGFLTLGRWMGAFAEFGWAWNSRPKYPLVAKWKTGIPSAEFTESFVIWLYGASNVFLEHLNNWGDEWSASDLEHLSITMLFFGGGLLGMLLEMRWVRELLNTNVMMHKSKDPEVAELGEGVGASRFAAAGGVGREPDQRWEEPSTARVPMNPMPALTIMLLGMMMGAHHQDSMVSTMMHAQWGGLFTAFALARGVTYVTMFLKPPTSHYPSRPPSEIVAAFCLTAGGFIFMNSSADTVYAIESNGLDAMTIFTVSMGLTGVLLAWEIVVFAIKGCAVRKEKAAAGKPLAS